MLFGLCNAPAKFKRLIQTCLGELSLTYHLIYLDSMIAFSKMEEEHLQHFHVYDCFPEHNLKLKPTKCKFFWYEINYLTHHFSREVVRSHKGNLKAVAGFTPSWTYTEILAFLGLVGHYQWFIKGFVHITQQLHKHSSREGVSKKGK